MSIEPPDPGGVPVALVFPGQGAQSPIMLEPFAGHPSFARRLARMEALIGADPLAESARDPSFLDRNLVSSLMTATASLLALDLWRAAFPRAEIVGYAGYSVGQWTALHAAGAIGEDELYDLVARRALAMDRALAGQGPGGMLAVIGLPAERVEAICAGLRGEGRRIAVSNDNAPNQLTLSGDLDALDAAEAIIRAERPRKLARVPVAGAWHGPAMEPAAAEFAPILEGVAFRATIAPVIDNVTGAPLSDPPTPAELARQLAAPVLWRQSVRALIGLGATSVIELGYGDLLTKFGFFIDRSATHRAIAPPPRVAPARVTPACVTSARVSPALAEEA
jgi:[acyl-carrier-protein] S-malonyltransferase